jgi:hypothetical protein
MGGGVIWISQGAELIITCLALTGRCAECGSAMDKLKYSRKRKRAYLPASIRPETRLHVLAIVKNDEHKEKKHAHA